MRRFALLGTLCFLLAALLAGSTSASAHEAHLGTAGEAASAPSARPDLARGALLRKHHRKHRKHHRKHHRRAKKLRKKALRGNRHALRLLSAPNDVCVGADEVNAGPGEQESAMGCLLNYARRKAGLAALTDLQKLDGAADNKAGDILRCNQFSHEACGRDFLYWFNRSGYTNARCWWVGENLAWGTGSLGSARSIMSAWLHSPDHRANLLSTQYTQYGMGLRVGSLSGNSNAHVWVNHFGRHC